MKEKSPDPQVVAKIIQTTPAVLHTLLDGVDDVLLSWRPAEGEWCIKEVIGHLLEMDTLAFGDRIRLILAEDTPEIPGLNVDQIAVDREDDKRPLSELLTDFAKERETAVTYLNQLSTVNLQRIGIFPVNRHFLASDFLYEWPYHDHEHLKQISDIFQTAVWSELSETMQKALKG